MKIGRGENKNVLCVSVQSGSLAPSTPLTGRLYLKEKDLLVTPVSSATQSVSRLQSMVAGLRTAPSENLINIFKSVPSFCLFASCFSASRLVCCSRAALNIIRPEWKNSGVDETPVDLRNQAVLKSN